MPEGSVTLTADISDLKKQLATIPGVTEAEARKMVKALETQLKQASKAAKDTWKGGKESAKDFAQSVDAIGDIAQSVGFGPIDDLATSAKHLFMGLGDLGVGAAAGLAVAGITAVGAASVGTVAGIVALVDKAAEWEKTVIELHELGSPIEPVDPGVYRSFQDVSNGLDAMGTLAKEAGILLAIQFAPSVEQATTSAVALGLAGLDVAGKWLETHNLLREVAAWLTDRFVQALTAPVDAAVSMAEGLADVIDALGGQGLTKDLHALKDGYDDWTRSVASTAVDHWIGKAADSLSDLTAASAAYLPQAEALIGAQGRLADKTKALKAAQDELIATSYGRDLRALVDQVDDLSQAVDRLVPPAALTQQEQLLDLWWEMAQAMGEDEYAASELADEMARVEGAMASLGDTAADVMPALEPSSWQGAADGLDTVRGGLQQIAYQINPILGAILAFVSEVDTIFISLNDEIVHIAENIGDLPALIVEGIEDVGERVLPALADSAREFADSLIDTITDPDTVQAINDTVLEGLSAALSGEELVALLDHVVQTFYEELSDPAALEDWARALVDSILSILGASVDLLGGGLVDTSGWNTKDLFDWGDTPGVQRVGQSGASARFAPGDRVVAARDTEGLLSQIFRDEAPARSSSGAMPYRETQRVFDAFMRDHLRLNSRLRSATTAAPRTGRINPYRGT